ncbi:MAG: YggT family protein [Candidatus Cloacimonetes bacterium]|nr:YggT family protein [Candidatus Cloacimonadota bacterium]
MIGLLHYALSVYEFLIFARAIISWFSPNPNNPLVQVLVRLTEPVLGPVRKWVPTPGIDFSPMIVILVIEGIKRLLLSGY